MNDETYKLLLTKYKLGDTVKIPAGNALVTRIIFELGWSVTYTVKAWLEDIPTSFEVYEEEIEHLVARKGE